MNDGESDSLTASDLLTPRDNLPWRNEAPALNGWIRPYLIDNRIARAHANSLLERESRERTILRDAVEGELARLSSVKQRFWIAEYRFIEKFLTFRQLVIYAPSFLSLTRIMPKKLVFCRRRIVREYIEQHAAPNTPFVARLCRQFIRTSVFFYPAEKLMEASKKFILLTNRSADQSKSANRHRVAMELRALHLMSDREICDQFRCEEAYLNELALLDCLARHYCLTVDDIFRISAAEIKHFWEMQG
ncbi:hypothetical protein [Sneathiella sp.]|uniref:hypothetical protein n=1 Tax=Sneathiella sp. TaxID=1964365 RepID=UPI002610F7D4|nr:hypothetical protein [Sneathiella sp.]MDF2366135.1 hypothetical protein [Sneathiella sp.]